MADESVIGVYSSMPNAEAAVRALRRGGFPISKVSIVARGLESERDIHGFITTGDVAKTGASTGAWVGGIFGLLAGAAFLWAPVIGPLVVAGPLVTALLGAVEGGAIGAAGGGVLGSLIGWGVSRNDVLKYEDHLKAGKFLVIAHGNAMEVARARDLLQQSGQASEVTVHHAVAAAA
jgi:hypothetical protein